jgi:hypothetical protein
LTDTDSTREHKEQVDVNSNAEPNNSQAQVLACEVAIENRELSFRWIAYNIHRLTNIVVIFRGFYGAHANI